MMTSRIFRPEQETGRFVCFIDRQFARVHHGYVNYFAIAGRSYKVIPQVLQVDRLNPSQVLDYYVRAPDGSLLPASTVATQRMNTVRAHCLELDS